MGRALCQNFALRRQPPKTVAAVRHWASHIENVNVLSDIDNSLSNHCVRCCLFCEKRI